MALIPRAAVAAHRCDWCWLFPGENARHRRAQTSRSIAAGKGARRIWYAVGANPRGNPVQPLSAW